MPCDTEYHRAYRLAVNVADCAAHKRKGAGAASAQHRNHGRNGDKMPANSFATSATGAQLKSLAARAERGVVHHEAAITPSNSNSRARFCMSTCAPHRWNAM